MTEFSTELTDDGWKPKLASPWQTITKIIDADYTMTAAEAEAGNVVVVNAGAAGLKLIYPASPSNCGHINIAVIGEPITVTSNESADVAVFRRAGLIYVPDSGFLCIDAQSSVVSSGEPVTTEATTVEQVMKSASLPSSSLKNDGDCLVIDFAIEKTSDATTETLRIKFGALGTIADTTLWATAAALATTSNTVYGQVTIMRVSSTALRVVSTPNWYIPFAGDAGAMSDVTVPDMDATTNFLTITGQNDTGAQTATIKRWSVKVVR